MNRIAVLFACVSLAVLCATGCSSKPEQTAASASPKPTVATGAGTSNPADPSNPNSPMNSPQGQAMMKAMQARQQGGH